MKKTMLTDKQAEKVLKNAVECIMDDLDNLYFDELIMKQYKKHVYESLKEKFKVIFEVKFE